MNDTFTKTLSALKKINLDGHHTSLWVIHRKLKETEAKYEVATVKINPNLERKLIKIVSDNIQKVNSVREYDYFTEDLDETQLLCVEQDATDLKEIGSEIAKGLAAKEVTDSKDLFDSWAYIIQLTDGTTPILALHKIPEGWRLRQKEKILNVIFKDRVLIDFEEDEVFRLDRSVDCIAYQGLVFVLNKAKFERALNFRAGMEKNLNALLDDFAKMDLFTDVQIIRDKVGTKLPFLRRVSMIKKNGYYKQQDYVNRLKTVCKKRGWDVKFQDNRIVVTQNNVELVLTLLNNDRLESPINSELFDVVVKQKVA